MGLRETKKLQTRQAMRGRRDQHQFVKRERFNLNRHVRGHFPHDRHVHAVAGQRVNQRGPVEHFQRDLDLGINLVKFAQQTRDDIRAYGGVSSHAQTAIVWTAQRLHAVKRLIDHGKYLLAVEV